jgi:cell fate regulator YaaT (PSP1 superfamily)
MIKSARFAEEKTPSCENCIYYDCLIKYNHKGVSIEYAHGKCSLRKRYKQRNEFCKQWYDKCDSK